MLDLKYIRENVELIKQGAINKRIKMDVDRLIQVDTEIRPLKQQLEAFQADRNAISKTIGKAAPDERDALKAKVNDIKKNMETFSAQLGPLEAELEQLMLLVPQPAREDVPVGKDDAENIELRKWGTPREFDFKAKDHVELGKIHNIIDIERGVKIAGSRSYILRGAGAIIEQAILRFCFDRLVKKGYTPMQVPVLVSEECMQGTGYFPTGRDQAYCVENGEGALVGTGEVSLTSYHAKEILKEADLPIKMITQSSCFRREAGTYGKDTQGLYRVHQFQKIEQVIVAPADPALSEKLHLELLENAEEILRALELPYRVVYVCTGDLGQGQLRKHDIETWMPSRQAYSETHSCSTFHDFQARRLKMRYKNSEGKPQFCYTLNNTAVASPRVLIPFLETHQQKDGSIKIPECLHPYTCGMTEIK